MRLLEVSSQCMQFFRRILHNKSLNSGSIFQQLFLRSVLPFAHRIFRKIWWLFNDRLHINLVSSSLILLHLQICFYLIVNVLLYTVTLSHTVLLQLLLESPEDTFLVSIKVVSQTQPIKSALFSSHN